MDLAKQYHDRYELSVANYDKECFTNGKWYTQVRAARRQHGGMCSKQLLLCFRWRTLNNNTTC